MPFAAIQKLWVYVDTSSVYDCYYLFATNFRIIYANNQSHTGNLYANSTVFYTVCYHVIKWKERISNGASAQVDDVRNIYRVVLGFYPHMRLECQSIGDYYIDNRKTRSKYCPGPCVCVCVCMSLKHKHSKLNDSRKPYTVYEYHFMILFSNCYFNLKYAIIFILTYSTTILRQNWCMFVANMDGSEAQ